jgi:hypothetical protein
VFAQVIAARIGRGRRASPYCGLDRSVLSDEGIPQGMLPGSPPTGLAGLFPQLTFQPAGQTERTAFFRRVRTHHELSSAQRFSTTTNRRFL